MVKIWKRCWLFSQMLLVWNSNNHRVVIFVDKAQYELCSLRWIQFWMILATRQSTATVRVKALKVCPLRVWRVTREAQFKDTLLAFTINRWHIMFERKETRWTDSHTNMSFSTKHFQSKWSVSFFQYVYKWKHQVP